MSFFVTHTHTHTHTYTHTHSLTHTLTHTYTHTHTHIHTHSHALTHTYTHTPTHTLTHTHTHTHTHTQTCAFKLQYHQCRFFSCLRQAILHSMTSQDVHQWPSFALFVSFYTFVNFEPADTVDALLNWHCSLHFTSFHILYERILSLERVVNAAVFNYSKDTEDE